VVRRLEKAGWLTAVTARSWRSAPRRIETRRFMLRWIVLPLAVPTGPVVIAVPGLSRVIDGGGLA
jgi:hypothetical protein